MIVEHFSGLTARFDFVEIYCDQDAHAGNPSLITLERRIIEMPLDSDGAMIGRSHIWRSFDGSNSSTSKIQFLQGEILIGGDFPAPCSPNAPYSEVDVCKASGTTRRIQIECPQCRGPRIELRLNRTYDPYPISSKYAAPPLDALADQGVERISLRALAVMISRHVGY